MSTSSTGSFFDHVPAGFPPKGITSNLMNPPTLRVPMILCSSIFLFFMVVMVLIRFYVRIWITRLVGWDDYFCAAAAVLSCLHSGLLISAVHVGLGTHLWDIRASVLMVENNVRWLDSPSLVYPVMIWLIKISILLLYLRIFHIEKKLRFVIQGSIVFLTLIYTAYVAVQVIQIMQCASIAALFTYPVCLNVYDIAVAQGIANVVSDFWVLLLPMPALLKLQLNRRRKLGLIALFSTGLITCAMSLVRCIQFTTTYAGADLLWTGAQISQYSVVEMNVAIIAASAPILPKFLGKLKSALATTRTTDSPAHKVKSLGFSSNASSCEKPDKLIRHNNTMIPCSEVQDDSELYQCRKHSSPIVRTDTYEVSSRAYHDA